MQWHAQATRLEPKQAAGQPRPSAGAPVLAPLLPCTHCPDGLPTTHPPTTTMADTSVLDAASACLLACLAQHGLALLPPGWLPPDLLDALRAEAAGVLEQAEAAAMACEEAAVASCAVQ